MEYAHKHWGEERVRQQLAFSALASPICGVTGPLLHCVTAPGWSGSPPPVVCCCCMCSRILFSHPRSSLNTSFLRTIIDSRQPDKGGLNHSVLSINLNHLNQVTQIKTPCVQCLSVKPSSVYHTQHILPQRNTDVHLKERPQKTQKVKRKIQ